MNYCECKDLSVRCPKGIDSMRCDYCGLPPKSLETPTPEDKKKTFKIGVSLNGLRRNAAYAYNGIVQSLNESESLQDWEKEELQGNFDDLRFALGILNACSVSEIEHFDDMSEQLKFVDFNPQSP